MLKFSLLALAFPSAVLSVVFSLDNAFSNSSYLFNKQYPNTTAASQAKLISYADESAEGGPWSEFKPFTFRTDANHKPFRCYEQSGYSSKWRQAHVHELGPLVSP